MNSVFVVFAKEKYNSYAARNIIGIADTIESARRMAELNADSYVECVIQELDIATMKDLNKKSSWRVILWDIVDIVSVRREHIYSETANAKAENRLISQYYDSAEFLIWADNKEAAIEEARRMLNERSN